MDRFPQIVVIVGPNGAGKSTLAPSLLAETLGIKVFVNADVIAQGLSAFSPDSTAMAAGRIMIERLRSLAEFRSDFAFETTLAARSYAGWIQELQTAGYRFHLVFLWLPSPDMAMWRVRRRVATGGHDIEPQTIPRRYRAGLENFFHLYLPIADVWRIYNNSSEDVPRLIASGNRSEKIEIVDAEVWQKLEKEYGHDRTTQS